MAAMASLAVASTCVSMSCVQMKAVGGQCRGVQRWGAGGVALRAAKRSGVEPDLLEEERDMYATAGEGEEDQFPWGKADGSHSWHEGDDGTFMEGIKEVFESAGGPTGGQAWISWLFLPGLFTGMALNIQQDFLFIYTVLFIFAFIGIEMAKPDKPSNFEPEMYSTKK